MLSPKELLDEYFVENRNRILEIAAFLDRLDRADPTRSVESHVPAGPLPYGRGSVPDATHGTATVRERHDFRIKALAAALAALAGPGPNYVSQIQMLLSDPTIEPIAVLDRKSAIGAYDRWSQEARQ